MDPHSVFCPDKGQRGGGNIGIHSQKERRYRCTTCGTTFAATRGTAFYRLHHPAEVMVVVVTLLCHGCPLQAIVAACGLDERTVRAWLHRAGDHSVRVHEEVAQTGQMDLGQVQADEICGKLCRGRVWQAMALAVPSRLWLGGAVCPARDGLTALLRRVAACATSTALLIGVDGFSAYVGAVRTGRRGRPRPCCWRRWARAIRGDGWWTSRAVWCAARRRPSRTPSRGPRAAPRSTPPLSSGSTPPSAPAWRR